MKPLLITLLAVSISLAQVLVTTETPRLRPLVDAVQTELTRLEIQTVARSASLLDEIAFQMTGATKTRDDINLLAAKEVITISMDENGTLCLTRENVEFGTVLGSTCLRVEVGSQTLTTAARLLTRRLYGKAPDPDTKVIKVKDHQTVTVYEQVVTVKHEAIPGTRKVFVPCNMCQGTGKINGTDCPFCAATVKHSGIETHYRPMTGKWVTSY